MRTISRTLSIGAANTAFTNTDLTSSPTQATIAPFWDDLHANGGVVGSGIYYQNFDTGGADERVVIQWNKVRYFSGGIVGNTITFQAVLYKDGRIRSPEIIAAAKWATAMLKNPMIPMPR